MYPPAQWSRRSVRYLAAPLLLLALGAGAARGQTLLPPDPARVVGNVVPFDGFVDENGRSFSTAAADGDGQPWIVSPMYTSCPNTCSAVTSSLHRAVEQAGLAASGVHIVSFSFDPNETAENLKAFRARMNLPDAWVTLRAADKEALERTLRRLDFRTITLSEGVFEHPNLVAVLAAGRRLSGFVFGVNFDAGELAKAVARARKGVSAVDRWRPYLFFFAVVGFLASGAAFALLLARRRARGRRGPEAPAAGGTPSSL